MKRIPGKSRVAKAKLATLSRHKHKKARRMKIMVFGSNIDGIHGAGAARYALLHRGAVWGQAEGLQGNSWAIPTKSLRKNALPFTVKQVARGVRKFLRFAEDHPEMIFELTPIGCGLAGFTPAQIAPLFADVPANVELPEVFLEYLSDDFMMERME